MAQHDERPPTAFVSYSYDSPEHKEWVLKLASRLRAHGVKATLDKWEIEEIDCRIEELKRCKALVGGLWPQWCWSTSSGRSSAGTTSTAPLVSMVFSPGGPTLVYDAPADQTDRDEQQGLMHLFMGALLALRNPRHIQSPMTRPNWGSTTSLSRVCWPSVWIRHKEYDRI
jgi:hypothetical protein